MLKAIKFLLASLIIVAGNGFFTKLFSQGSSTELLKVFKTRDFTITGSGDAREWNNTDWLKLNPYKNGKNPYETKVKTLYSETGMYFLFHCVDTMITSTMKADFLDLWKEDVVEVFLHTDTTHPSYFEYEVSPRNFELPLLIANEKGELRRWMPFYYEQNRKVKHQVVVHDKDGKTTGWTAEFFIPYTLLSPLKHNVPASGMRWRANFYRVDYDGAQYASWLWKPVRSNFHDFEKFGTIEFQ